MFVSDHSVDYIICKIGYPPFPFHPILWIVGSLLYILKSPESHIYKIRTEKTVQLHDKSHFIPFVQNICWVHFHTTSHYKTIVQVIWINIIPKPNSILSIDNFKVKYSNFLSHSPIMLHVRGWVECGVISCRRVVHGEVRGWRGAGLLGAVRLEPAAELTVALLVRFIQGYF